MWEQQHKPVGSASLADLIRPQDGVRLLIHEDLDPEYITRPCLGVLLFTLFF